MKKHKNAKSNDNLISTNKKAFHNYQFEKTLEAGISMQGWEVKSIRANKINFTDSYVIIKNNEIWLIGSLINPLNSVCTHYTINPTRTRKLLLHRKEIQNLIGLTKQKGYTLVPQSMYWHKNRIKVKIGLAKGKKTHDKRADLKTKDWNLQKQRLMKNYTLIKR